MLYEKDIKVYTDGSCKKSAGIGFGGWSYIIVIDDVIHRYESGGEAHSTNQRMELMAAINALKFLDTMRLKQEVVLYSDSAYLINCANDQWYKDWQKNGWLNSRGKEVSNEDLWRILIPYFNHPKIFFRHILGHNGNIFNERCDKLAQTAAEKERQHWKGERKND